MKTTYNPKKPAVLLTAKTRLPILKLLLLLCSALAMTSVFGQTTFVWTNQYAAHLAGAGDMNQNTNWDPNGFPSSSSGPDVNNVFGDECMFDGRTTGPLSVTESGGGLSGGGGSGNPLGARTHLTANQTAPVTIFSVLSVSAGMRIQYFTIDAGAGGLTLGDHSVNCFDIVDGTLNGQIQGFTNNSATPCVVNETVRWREGGAGAHPHVFAGTGDWIVNNHMRSANSSAVLVQKDGPGTMTWTGTNTANANFPDTLGSPVRIFAGTMILKSSDLLNAAAGGANPVGIVHNGTLLKFDYTPTPGIVTTPDSIPGNISGSGPIQVNVGTITLAGASTFSGNINLTGGELIAGSAESVGVSGPLGQGGIISFNGGTLGWNLANAFDYSSRFDTSANQVYNLDTGGASPTLATGLSSSGGALNKLGGGTLTLAGANAYTGLTTVSVGQLLFQGTKSGNANITVADSAVLGVVENDSQITPGTLTLGASTGATLEFNNVTNHSLATLVPNTLAATGPVTINVNSGRFRLIGETFPLLKWTTGSAPAVSLGFLAGAGGHLVTNISGVEIDLVIDDPPYIWTDLAANDIWNTTSVDWLFSGANVAWVNGHYSLMDDTAGGTGNVTLSGIITPTNATINNSALAYAITNSPGNVIGGPGSLTKNGNGTLILPGGANTYTGVTTISGGVLDVNVLSNGGSASDIGAASSAAPNIVISGGTLLYTGPGVDIDRLFSVGPNGATIDSEGAAALAFTNTGSLGMSGNGPRVLTLTGPNVFGDTIASAIVNHPAGTSLAKNGAGTWILTGTNTYANGTTIASGTLQVGVGGQSGTIGNGNISTATGTIIDLQRVGNLLVPGAISGGGSVFNDGTGTVILANNNSYSGGTTINAGTLQVGNGGGTGSLNPNIAIINNTLLVFNTGGSFIYQSGGLISGPGNVIVQGGGFIKAIGANTYTGWTRIDANTTFQPKEGQDGALVSSVVTNNGTLRLVAQDATFTYPGPIVGTGKVQIGANNVNVGVMTLTGTNTYTGGTFIGDNTLVLGDGANAGSGTMAGNVQFVNNFTLAQDNPRTLTFNRPAGDDFTFSGTITTNFTTPQANLGIVQQNGGDKLTLTGNNTYGGGTVINAGIVQVGAGGASGSLGFGPVTNNALLVFNRTGSLAVGTVTGSGSLTQLGTATVTLTGVSSLGGDVDLEAGTFGAAPSGFVGSLSVGGNMTIASGVTILAGLNLALSPSNSVYTVTGSINYTSGGTLRLLNSGPFLQVGDKFTIFSQPVTNMAVVLPGFTVQNDLGVDGSITVTAVTPLTITTTTSGAGGATLNLSWPASWTGGVHLQSQTNGITKGLSTNWVTIPGTDLSNTYSATINKTVSPTNGCVFYRLIAP